MVNKEDLKERLEKFNADFDGTKLEEAIKQIGIFNEKYPRKSIESLTKEKYVLGLPPREDQELTFSWWVEYGAVKLARMGGYPSKHRLYFSSKDGKYKYPLQYKNEDECFEDIKVNLLKLYALLRVKDSRLEDFDKIIALPTITKLQICHLINRRRFLPVISEAHLRIFCSYLEVTNKEDTKNLNAFTLNSKLLLWFRGNSLTKGWHPFKMSQYLYYKNGCYCGLNVKVKDNNQYPPNEPIEDCIKRVDQKKGGKAPVSIEGDQLIEVLTKKKQVILYGPPGTGKTYNTKKIAVDLLGRE